jgi:hypothetical protein
MAHDVFISHSTKDKLTADAVCAVLESNGIRCWVAPRDIVPGKNWGESIIDAIKGARVMVLILSGHANESVPIKNEVERAVSKGVTVIPMRIEDVVPSSALEFFISSSHWLDAFVPPLESHLKYLTQVIRQILGRPLTEVPAKPAPEPLVPEKAQTEPVRKTDAAAKIEKEKSETRETKAAIPETILPKPPHVVPQTKIRKLVLVLGPFGRILSTIVVVLAAIVAGTSYQDYATRRNTTIVGEWTGLSPDKTKMDIQFSADNNVVWNVEPDSINVKATYSVTKITGDLLAVDIDFSDNTLLGIAKIADNKMSVNFRESKKGLDDAGNPALRPTSFDENTIVLDRSHF